MSQDALFNHFFGPQRSARALLARTLFFIDECRFREEHGLVMTLNRSVALIGLPGHLVVPADKLSRLTYWMIGVLPDQWTVGWSEIELLDALKPAFLHVYLSAIATSARHRHRGYGGKLLKELMLLSDHLELPIYLEVSSEQGRRWYKDLGFVTIGEARFSTGLRVYGMLRQPRGESSSETCYNSTSDYKHYKRPSHPDKQTIVGI